MAAALVGPRAGASGAGSAVASAAAALIAPRQAAVPPGDSRASPAALSAAAALLAPRGVATASSHTSRSSSVADPALAVIAQAAAPGSAVAELCAFVESHPSPPASPSSEVDDGDASPRLASETLSARDQEVRDAIARALSDGKAAQAQKPAQRTAEVPKVRIRHLFVTSPPGTGKTTLVQRMIRRLKEDEKGQELEVVGFYTEEVRDTAGQRAGFDIVRLGGGPPTLPSRIGFARIGDEPPKVGKYSVDLNGFEACIVPAIEATPKPPPKRKIENPRLCTYPDGRQIIVDLVREEATPSVPMRPSCPDFEAESEEEPDQEKHAVVYNPARWQEEHVELSQLGPVPEDWEPEEDDDEDGAPRVCVVDEVGKMALQSLKFPTALYVLLDSRAIVLGTLPQPTRGQRDHEVVERVKKRPDVRVLKMTRGNRDALLDQAYEILRECLDLGPPGAPRTKRIPSKKRLLEEARLREEAAKREAELKAAEDERIRAQEEKVKKRLDRESKAKEEVKKREELAKKAREERKRRVDVRQKKQQTGKGGAMEVDEVDDDDGDVQVDTKKAVALVDDDELEVTKHVKAVVALVDDVDARAPPPKKARAAAASPSPLASPPAAGTVDIVDDDVL